MFGRDYVKGISGVIASLFFAAGSYSFVVRHENIPMFIFWLCLQMVVFADIAVIRNMVMQYRLAAQNVSESQAVRGAQASAAVQAAGACKEGLAVSAQVYRAGLASASVIAARTCVSTEERYTDNNLAA